MAREIVDLLAELPARELAAMREKNQRSLARARSEVARLELEAQQLETAAARRERRKPGRPGSLTPEIVLDAARETESPMTASAVQETLVGRGLKVSVNAVRNHLNTLVERGELERDENRRYVPSVPLFVPEFTPSADFPTAEPDDIPF